MKEYVEKIVFAAVAALWEELDTTPKPGLIDKNGSGAHKDMDYALFAKSIGAIEPYLKRFALVAEGSSDVNSLALALKDLGMRAENAMFAATSGVNTHKGAIFTLGLTIAAAASKNIDGVTRLEHAQKQISALAEALSPLRSAGTHGHEICQKYNVGGAFGQALDGYRGILSLTLPLFERCEKSGFDKNKANILVLLSLMATLDDTNVLYRAGEAAYKNARAKAAALLDNFTPGALQYLCMDFNANNISFGGAADMLMLSVFVKKLFSEGILTR